MCEIHKSVGVKDVQKVVLEIQMVEARHWRLQLCRSVHSYFITVHIEDILDGHAGASAAGIRSEVRIRVTK